MLSKELTLVFPIIYGDSPTEIKLETFQPQKLGEINMQDKLK